MIRNLLAPIAATLCSFATASALFDDPVPQEKVKEEKPAELKVDGAGLLGVDFDFEGGPIQIGGPVQFGAIDVNGLMMNGNSGGVSFSVENVNGVKTTKINVNGDAYTFAETDEGLEASVLKSYSKKNLQELEKDHPDLMMHVGSFPEHSGEDEVEDVIIKLKKKIKVKDLQELKEKHENIHAIYEKFSKEFGEGGFQIFGGGLRIQPAIQLQRGAIEIPAEVLKLELKADGNEGPAEKKE